MSEKIKTRSIKTRYYAGRECIATTLSGDADKAVSTAVLHLLSNTYTADIAEVSDIATDLLIASVKMLEDGLRVSYGGEPLRDVAPLIKVLPALTGRVFNLGYRGNPVPRAAMEVKAAVPGDEIRLPMRTFPAVVIVHQNQENHRSRTLALDAPSSMAYILEQGVEVENFWYASVEEAHLRFMERGSRPF